MTAQTQVLERPKAPEPQTQASPQGPSGPKGPPRPATTGSEDGSRA
jgi:hypothetical protein